MHARRHLSNRCEGSTAFFVVLGDKERCLPRAKVGQLLPNAHNRTTKALEARLSALETGISELKSLILLNESDSFL